MTFQLDDSMIIPLCRSTSVFELCSYMYSSSSHIPEVLEIIAELFYVSVSFGETKNSYQKCYLCELLFFEKSRMYFYYSDTFLFFG